MRLGFFQEERLFFESAYFDKKVHFSKMDTQKSRSPKIGKRLKKSKNKKKAYKLFSSAAFLS